MTRWRITGVCLGLIGCGAGAEAPEIFDAAAADTSITADANTHDAGLEDAGLEDAGRLDDDSGSLPFDGALPPPEDAGTPNEWTTLSAALADHCRRCHNGGQRRRVDRWGDLVGVEALQVRAPLIAPGDPDGSYLLAKLLGTHADFCDRAGQPLANCGRRMPPNGAGLSTDEQLLLRAWIARGAPAE